MYKEKNSCMQVRYYSVGNDTLFLKFFFSLNKWLFSYLAMHFLAWLCTSESLTYILPSVLHLSLLQKKKKPISLDNCFCR